ncbi:Cinnamoyl-CoA reductase 1 [Allomyces javanicus]|nr:Cinnamoyl-CoA reductase 1 [Allomyces javanicus]
MYPNRRGPPPPPPPSGPRPPPPPPPPPDSPWAHGSSKRDAADTLHDRAADTRHDCAADAAMYAASVWRESVPATTAAAAAAHAVRGHDAPPPPTSAWLAPAAEPDLARRRGPHAVVGAAAGWRPPTTTTWPPTTADLDVPRQPVAVVQYAPNNAFAPPPSAGGYAVRPPPVDPVYHADVDLWHGPAALPHGNQRGGADRDAHRPYQYPVPDHAPHAHGENDTRADMMVAHGRAPVAGGPLWPTTHGRTVMRHDAGHDGRELRPTAPVCPYLGPTSHLSPPTPPAASAAAYDPRAIEFSMGASRPAGPGPPPLSASWWRTTAPPARTPSVPVVVRPAAAPFSTTAGRGGGHPAASARGPPASPPGTSAMPRPMAPPRRAIDTLEIARMRWGGPTTASAPRRAVDTLELARMRARATHVATVAAPQRTWVPELAHRDRPWYGGGALPRTAPPRLPPPSAHAHRSWYADDWAGGRPTWMGAAGAERAADVIDDWAWGRPTWMGAADAIDEGAGHAHFVHGEHRRAAGWAAGDVPWTSAHARQESRDQDAIHPTVRQVTGETTHPHPAWFGVDEYQRPPPRAPHDAAQESLPVGHVAHGGHRVVGGPGGAPLVAEPPSAPPASPPGECGTVHDEADADRALFAAVQNRRRRLNLSAETRAVLLAWVDAHRENPYPTKADKLDLVAATGLPLAKLETWFINMRRRSLKTTTAAAAATTATVRTAAGSGTERAGASGVAAPRQHQETHQDRHQYHHEQQQQQQQQQPQQQRALGAAPRLDAHTAQDHAAWPRPQPRRPGGRHQGFAEPSGQTVRQAEL